LGCHLDVALDGDVGRAFGLAGARSGRIHHLAVLPVGVPLVRSPNCISGSALLLLRYSQGGWLADVLAQGERVDLAVLDAFAAGYALRFVNGSHIVGARKVGVPEVGGAAQTKAGATATVTYGLRLPR